jgi:hypothetical protein
MGCLTGLSRILHAYSLERKAEWGAIQAPWDLIPAHIADRAMTAMPLPTPSVAQCSHSDVAPNITHK